MRNTNNNNNVVEQQPLNNIMGKQQASRHTQSFGEQETPLFEVMNKAEVFDEMMRLQYGMESLIEEEEVLDGIMKEDVGLLDMEAFEEEKEFEDSSFVPEEDPEYYFEEGLEEVFMENGEVPIMVDPEFVETDPTDDEEEMFDDVMEEEEFEMEMEMKIDLSLEEKEKYMEDEIFDETMRMQYGMVTKLDDEQEELKIEMDLMLEEKEKELEDEVFDNTMRMQYGMAAKLEEDPTVFMP
jgi:hypothetical protein